MVEGGGEKDQKPSPPPKIAVGIQEATIYPLLVSKGRGNVIFGAEIKFARVVLKSLIGDWRYAGSPFAEEIGGL
jgi:hypothetical protein